MGLSVLQLLPLNDVGQDFRPYDASSSFALEPMHLSLERLSGVPAEALREEADRLRKKFPLKNTRFFDTGIKREKLEVLRRVFDGRKGSEDGFERFKSRESAWLDPYVQFKALKAKFSFTAWETWPKPYRDRHCEELAQFSRHAFKDLEFERWVQWQCSVQLENARRESNREGILLVGDLPFLVARDSADVWAEPSAFKLDRASGAPPDLYFAEGQAWGMPPHDWVAQERTGFAYLRRKVAYAARFYDAFRIDHFVGLFRVWTYELNADGTARRETGAFDPSDEAQWEPQARKILDAMLDGAALLPCAEDLGVVPNASAKVLREYGIPGMEIQRWMRHWDTDKEWKSPGEYRSLAVAMISTHDMAPLELWWKNEMTEAGERERFLRFCPGTGAMDREFARAALRASLASASIFSIQLFQDWFALEHPGATDEEERINFPGLIKDSNWRYLSRYSLEEMNKLACRSDIHSLVSENNRLT